MGLPSILIAARSPSMIGGAGCGFALIFLIIGGAHLIDSVRDKISLRRERREREEKEKRRRDDET